MSLPESSYGVTSGLMEGYRQYLIHSRKVTQFTVRMYVNIVRRFHNHVGKPYIAINQEDIQGYVNFLRDSEQRTVNSAIRHLAAIRKFYDYLSLRGEIANNPCDGVRLKAWPR